jgi:energy-coupling factor transporter ATP-binding protein EcfA2
MKHLSEFEIRAFRNVKPTTLKFRPGLNVVLGRNAAGKTTLLNLLADSLGVVTAEPTERTVVVLVRDGANSLSRSRTVTTVIGQDRSRTGELAIAERFDADFAEGRFSATIGEGSLQLDEQVRPVAGPPLGTLVDALRERSPALLLRFLGLADTDSHRLDESLDYFHALLAFRQVRGGPSASYYSPSLPAGMRRFEIMHDKDVGPNFTATFLDRAARTMGYQRAHGRIDVESKTTGATTETRLTNLRFGFSSGQDSFTHTSLSYGEKRLLAFFAISDACPDIVIADELVNGLHHEWIKACIEELGQRQAFLTSQNPLLLDYLEFESASDVQKGFVLCERSADRSQLLWRNPSDEEAAEFFAAYTTGIQTVSEILVSKGFW